MPLSAYSQIAIIGNKSLAKEDFSRTKLIDVFTLNKQTWDNGSKVVIFDYKGSNSSKSNFYSWLGFSESEIQKIWLKKQFSGKGIPPKTLNSTKDIIHNVASVRGAIAYVPYSEVTDDVVVIKIIK